MNIPQTGPAISPSTSPVPVPPSAASRAAPHRLRPRTTRRIVWYVAVTAASIIGLYPLLVMFFTGLKPAEELAQFPPPLLPDSWQWGNYWTVITENGFIRQFVNSLVYAGGTMLGNVVFCSLAGYAFAKMRFRGRNVLFAVVVALLMVPAQSQLVPVFIVIQKIPFAGGNNWLGQGGSGLLNTYAGLLLPSLVTPLGIFLMRQFFSSIPDDYIEAARIDGASAMRIFRSIMMPLARPAVATLSIIAFQASWNDFVWPLVLTSTSNMATLQLGLQLYQTGQDAQTNLLMAASTITVIPMLILFFAAQKHFVGGLSAGLKG